MKQTYIFKDEGETLLPLWDYGWFSISTLAVSNSDLENYNPDDLFSSLLSDQLYQRSYMAPKEMDKTIGSHGPFKIEGLKSDDFVRIDFQGLMEHLKEDFNYPRFTSPPAENQQDEVLSHVNKLASDEVDYFMLNVNHDPDEKKEINQEFYWVLDIFREYILVQRKKKKIFLCVIGLD